MKHDKKKLISYLLMVVMLVTALFGSAVSVSAAQVSDVHDWQLGSSKYSVHTEDGKKVYQLNQDLNYGLKINLENDTVILDGQNHTVSAGNSGEDTSILVTGDGTLILRMICAEGVPDGGHTEQTQSVLMVMLI